ncbi:cupredoxin domain-containing protein [Haloarchaeobius sp. DFWS5]|uniref:cupredoxin domain-containing protein n=1 Tax=Haloarchaeobius sp. DFWS5 TaxID=3446114 RepID=UPI003EBAD1B3
MPIPEFYFCPTGLAIDSGDVVKFDFVTGHHTVSGYHPGFGYKARVPDGVPPFSSPVMPTGGYWLYRFEEAGVYDYFCGPHEIFGHVGRIVVGAPNGFEPIPDPCAGGPPEAGEGHSLRIPGFTANTVLRDAALDPDHIVDEGRVPWDDIAQESKRPYLQPVGWPPCDSSTEEDST